MRIGFIGLGQMGHGMVLSLLRAGIEVIVYNRTISKAQPLAKSGAIVARDVAEACRCDIVITMLANDQAVEELTFGDKGILASLKANGIHISSSTISVDLSQRLWDEHRRAGQRYVAAPVLGRPDRAAEGELFIVAAGEKQALAEATAIFEALGQGTRVMGDEPPKANL